MFAALAVAAAAASPGQCLSCQGQAAPAPVVTAQADGLPPWRKRADGDQWDLFLGGRHVGTYRRSSDKYWPISANPTAYEAVDDVPPVPVPREAFPTPEQWKAIHGPRTKGVGATLPTGVDSDKIRQSPAYMAGEQPITQSQVLGSLTGVAVPNDKGRVYATVVASSSAVRKPVEDFLTAQSDRFIVKGFDRGEWAVRPEAFAPLPDGDPVVILTGAARPDGKAPTYWLQAGGDFAALAQGTAEALRRSDPNWRPDAAPGPHNLPLAGRGGDLLAWGAIAVCCGLFFLFFLALVVVAVVVAVAKKSKG